MSSNFYFRKIGEVGTQSHASHVCLLTREAAYFQAHEKRGIQTFKDWVAILEQGHELVDESGEVRSVDSFINLVKMFRNVEKAEYWNSPVMTAKELPKGILRYKDEEGYLFFTEDFS